MKKFLSRYFPAIPVIIVLVSMMFSNSCANTSQAPSGGKKDTIPPVLIKCVPANGTTNVPVKGAVLTFTFDEYVVVKTASNIFLSPPQQKMLKTRMKGKSLEVRFEEDLQPDMTYTLSFTDAIKDNNEGNVFPGFTYVFSTGDSIDSMLVTGTVRDSKTLKPMKGMTVMLYKDCSDSAVLVKRPFAAALTDDWGYFCIRNIKDTSYRLYAVKDDNSNKMYDAAENELIAFVDSIIRPTMRVVDSLPEVKAFDMKDTIGCQSRTSQYELALFRARPTRQMIVNKVRVSDRSSYITFMAPDTHIDSMWMSGVKPDRLITQFNTERDSLEIWVNDKQRMPDTLNLFVNYRKTDSLGRLSPETEKVRLYVEGVGSKNRKRKQVEHQDTICVLDLKAVAENVEQDGFQLEFTYPIVNECFDSLEMISINPKQIESRIKYRVVQDSTNIRRYSIFPEEKMLVGYDYKLKLPHRGFRDINGYYSDSTEVTVKLPSSDKLSTLNLVLGNVENRYIVELLNEKQTTVLRSYVVTSNGTISFPYLKKGKYSIRIANDVNGNGLIDTGSLMAHRQPEKVIFLKFNKKEFIDMPESVDIDQEVNVAELFGNQ
ncbi:MAG: Ig-like domain-containing protein [Bacteroidales bacterium]|nr:Ig-like domain-containing protein [Bacteroidales bacterium]